MTDVNLTPEENQPLPLDEVPIISTTPTSPTKREDAIVVRRTTLNYLVIAFTFFALGLGLGVFYFGNSAPVDETALAEIVRELLVEAELLHPRIDDMYTIVDDDPYLGAEDAPVIIVEFSAYACPFCGRHYNETLEPLLENYGQYIRYVYRDHPIINQNLSFPAAIAANCAKEQGHFWEYHRMLFENQNVLGTSFFAQAASDLGLDVDDFLSCFQDETMANEVLEDYNDANDLHISGTPSFYINGTFHSGAQSYEYFESIIIAELAELGIEAVSKSEIQQG